MGSIKIPTHNFINQRSKQTRKHLNTLIKKLKMIKKTKKKKHEQTNKLIDN